MEMPVKDLPEIKIVTREEGSAFGFSDEQIKRLDDICEAAYQFLTVLAETDDIPYDVEAIWNVIYEGSDRLQKNYQRRIRIPTRVTHRDGTSYITDWYGEENIEC